MTFLIVPLTAVVDDDGGMLGPVGDQVGVAVTRAMPRVHCIISSMRKAT
jgi:hypothetical protein